MSHTEENQSPGSSDRDRAMMVRGQRSNRRRLSSRPSSGGEGTEEEDMANCLILLAQGDKPKKRARPRLDEIAGAAVAGAFECKTCNRAFPSFQALGGHRASHKKPKLIPMAAIGEKVKKLSFFTVPGETEETNINEKTNPNKGKSNFHECSICRVEFSSGQALGGHMRRHRAQAATVADEGDQIKDRNSPPLDLNLPPPEDDRRDTLLQFPATQQPLGFPYLALVDCYY